MKQFFGALLLTWVCFALPALAQVPANLIADRIDIQADGSVLAFGNVRIWQGDQSLTAQTVRYQQENNTLQIEGPIEMTLQGNTTILASQAELSPDFKTGIILGARMLIDQKLQVVGSQLSRNGDRYSQAFNIAATSCSVCQNEIPLWQIRAKRFVHDTQEKQLHFEDVQLRIYGVPVFYFPYFRLPDPSLKRATGFLVPEYSSNTLLGLGVKIPYFIKLGDHRDVTLTPLVSAESKALFYKYRQAFAQGTLEFSGAVAQDTLIPGTTRGYVHAFGETNLNSGYLLSYGLQAVSDPSFNSTYEIGLPDRLRSHVTLDRTQQRAHDSYQISAYHSLRASDDNATQPTLLGDIDIARRYYPNTGSGIIDWNLNFHASQRYSSLSIDGPDADTEVDGFDLARLTSSLKWSQSSQLASGIQIQSSATAEASIYNVNQHSAFETIITNAQISAQSKLSWPVVRSNSFGGQDVLTPMIGFSTSLGRDNDVPNLDSSRIEFDEGNLFSTDQSPGYDVNFAGTAYHLGVGWKRTTANGSRYKFALGKVVRDTVPTNIAASSGVSTKVSDTLVSIGYQTNDGISLLSRGIIDSNNALRKAQTRLALSRTKFNLGLTHTWLEADVLEDRPIAFSELIANGSFKVSDRLNLSANARYDARNKSLSNVESILTYYTSCLRVDFSVTRRLSVSANVPSVTDFGIKIDMAQFGIGSTLRRKTHSCGGT